MQGNTIYKFSGFSLDTGSRSLANSDNTKVTLTSADYNMLLRFCEHPQQLLGREFLATRRQDRPSALGEDRCVDVQVTRLRRRLDDDSKAPEIILTIRATSGHSGGYWFAPEVTACHENIASPEGILLGRELARLCDAEFATSGKRDDRCKTCAFRGGNHTANGSGATLMDALKCAIENVPFFCHEPGKEHRPCAGWSLMRFPKDEAGEAPWEFTGGVDA